MSFGKRRCVRAGRWLALVAAVGQVVAIGVGLGACRESASARRRYPPDPPDTPLTSTGGPARDLQFTTECANATFRHTAGSRALGVLNVQVRIRVATNSDGQRPVGNIHAYAKRDIEALNKAFEPVGIRFIHDEAPQDFAPNNELYDTVHKKKGGALFAAMCDGSLGFDDATAMTIVYVHRVLNEDHLDDPKEDWGGLGGFCGLTIPTCPSEKCGEQTPPEALAHEVGHYLALLHTHDCQDDPSVSPRDPLLGGDQIPDTPFDPGPIGTTVCTAGDVETEGVCTLAEVEGSGCRSGRMCIVACPEAPLPDWSNYMSYYSQGSCDRDHFSEEQILLMRCVLAEDHSTALVSCPSGQTICGPEGCRDTQTSGAHCGACDNDCASNQICRGGKCVCDPSCRGKCGITNACGQSCGCFADEICVSYECVPEATPCEEGQQLCSCCDGEDVCVGSDWGCKKACWNRGCD